MTGAITELDTRRAIKRDWYLNLGAHEGFTEEELFKLKIEVDVYHWTQHGLECSRKKQLRQSTV